MVLATAYPAELVSYPTRRYVSGALPKPMRLVLMALLPKVITALHALLFVAPVSVRHQTTAISASRGLTSSTGIASQPTVTVFVKGQN
jgi:hypothetical protein